jgi:phospholipid/cholesterol/gamma-HCH transport system substrate-binding protein
MMRTLRTNLVAIIAYAALATVAAGVAYYILQQQGMRIPFVEEKPFKLEAAFSTAQAVTPGQGQTVRVSGIRVGDISRVRLENGRAVVELDLDQKFKRLVHTDASAFLRPKTGLKDMFIELNPGTKRAPVATEGWRLPVASTLPDVNPDEFLAGLDTDTRDYLRLLINGAGRGLEDRGDDLGAVLRRFEPTYRDLSRVTRTVARRRVELRRLVSSLSELNVELAGKDDELAGLVQNASRSFRALASERDNVAGTVRELPSTLRQATSTLGKVDRFANQLRPTADKLVPVAGALRRANVATRPFAEEAAPLLAADVRPFVREAQPLVRELVEPVKDLVEAEPSLSRSFRVFNHLFNMLAYNQNGREPVGKPGREEGYLFHLAWVSHQAVNLFSNADAHGPQRTLTLGGTCPTLRGTAESAPQAEFLLGLTGALTDPLVCGAAQSTRAPDSAPISNKARGVSRGSSGRPKASLPPTPAEAAAARAAARQRAAFRAKERDR